MSTPTATAPSSPAMPRAGRVRRFAGQVGAELRAVTWPAPRRTAGYTAVVLSFLGAMVALVGCVDAATSALVLRVFG